MIRSAFRSVSYLVEDVVSVARWAVGEVVAELDYRLQPAHVRQGWAAELADIEAGIDVHEPNAPYLQWGGPETWPQSGAVPCPVDDCPATFDRYNDLNRHSLKKHLQQDPTKVGSGPNVQHWRYPGIDDAGDFKWHTFSRSASDPYCNRCGYPHPTTQTCLRDQSSAVPPTADRPAGVVADPPSAPPAGHPHVEAFVPEEDRIATSTLLREAANYIDAVFPVCDSKYVGRLTTNLRKRSAAFAAVENTT